MNSIANILLEPVGAWTFLKWSALVLGVPLVAFWIWDAFHQKNRKIVALEAEKRDSPAVKEALRKNLVFFLTEHSTVCKGCGGRLVPLPDSDDRYTCISCATKSRGKEHRLSAKTSELIIEQQVSAHTCDWSVPPAEGAAWMREAWAAAVEFIRKK